MQFKLTTEFLEEIHKAIEENDIAELNLKLKDLHAVDIAEVLNKISHDDASIVFKLLDKEIIGDVLIELGDDLREKILSSLTSKEIAEQFIDKIDSDDAADVIAELPDKIQGEVLSHMESTEQASDIVELLNYDENTAGGIMATEIVYVSVNSNVLECVRELRRQAEEVENVDAIYVVDDHDKLLGLLSLKRLLTTPLRSKVKDIYNPKIISVQTNTPSEEVAMVMDKYDLNVLPVVDQIGKLVGRITIDDVVDLIRKEETEDVQKMGGLEALDEPYMEISLLQMIKKRAGWLIILFVGETLTATAMSFFEDQISKAVVLALFVPLIISSGGNTGSQASTLVIRALALNEINIREWWKIVKKELKMGLILGLILGLFGFLRVSIWSLLVNVYGPHWLLIAFTVSFSLVGVVMWGNITGSLLPLLLKKMGLDPAVSSAPFVATLVDVTGLIIYFSFSTFFLKGVLL